MSSLLIVFLGMSVPILAAAPFYIADRREGGREAPESAQLLPGIEAPRIWPQSAVEPQVPEREIPESRTPEETNALGDTVRIEQDRVPQP
ncbi:hypothetical protein E1161_24760 [Saccharopolyspora aridisoli]|uniref:Uncharacterized protein n=1 Tax=Saccharopolyspora aridisoli TaxID=2530385 RepID=A0A4R4UA25_9PSEU|nr:hypothetical protein [Saccharopolyspora aridisoli]TDC87970.1 hypothetical protein E1161_24760 [Saccharopolyspora aridisoli]